MAHIALLLAYSASSSSLSGSVVSVYACARLSACISQKPHVKTSTGPNFSAVFHDLPEPTSLTAVVFGMPIT